MRCRRRRPVRPRVLNGLRPSGRPGSPRCSRSRAATDAEKSIYPLPPPTRAIRPSGFEGLDEADVDGLRSPNTMPATQRSVGGSVHTCRQRPVTGRVHPEQKHPGRRGTHMSSLGHSIRIRPRAWSRLGAGLLAVLIGGTMLIGGTALVPAARAASEPAPPLPDAGQEAVAGTQVRLVVSGFDPRGIDGVGPQTQAAYRSWQSSRQLPPDGVSKP